MARKLFVLNIMNRLNSMEEIQFYDADLTSLAREAVSFLRLNHIYAIDLGCGDGKAIVRLSKLIRNHTWFIGIDISMKRCRNAKRLKLKNLHIIRADALNTPFREKCFRLVNCSMLIEHVKDDRHLLLEIYRIIEKNGVLVISTVLKKKYGIYFYRRNGKFVLDPTHLREYISEDEFLSLLRCADFDVRHVRVTPVRYSILDFFFRTICHIFPRYASNVRNVYLNYPVAQKLKRNLTIQVPGYYEIEALCFKSAVRSLVSPQIV